MMGVKEQDKSLFFQTAQANFSTIFAADNQTAGQALAALQQVMAKDSVLAAYIAA